MDTDEVVRDQTWTEGERRAGNGTLCGCVCERERLFCAATVCVVSPMRTEKKKIGMGMLRTGQVMLRNQFGVMGKKRRKRRKKNKLLRFSSTFLGMWKAKDEARKERGRRRKVNEESRRCKQPRFLRCRGGR